jgi:hypothetical protein
VISLPPSPYSYMRLCFAIWAMATPVLESSYSFSSKSFSSSSYYTNINGKEDSGSTNSESYTESDSKDPVVRHGEGRIEERNGKQVYESVKNCIDGHCESETEYRLRRIIPHH